MAAIDFRLCRGVARAGHVDARFAIEASAVGAAGEAAISADTRQQALTDACEALNSLFKNQKLASWKARLSDARDLFGAMIIFCNAIRERLPRASK